MDDYKNLEKLRMLLGIPQENSNKMEVINFIWGKAKEMVKNYCHIDTIPEELIHTILSIAVELYRDNEYGSEELMGKVNTIKEGDVSIHFDSAKNGFYSNASLFQEYGGFTFLKNYALQLDRYRKMGW